MAEQSIPARFAEQVAAGPDRLAVKDGARRLTYAALATFVTLDALPVTPIGKIDRAALPDPGRGRSATLPPLVAPRTPVETIVAEIWADVLDLDVVGVADDFLDLGGHSLSAAQIAHRVLKSLQVDVPLAVLMEAPTVAGMALVVVEHCAKSLGADAVARFLDGGENVSPAPQLDRDAPGSGSDP